MDKIKHSYSFTARGHENILAAHAKTLEFTKDKNLSKAGDCIVGVSADFRLAPLRKMVKTYHRMVMNVRVGKHVETVEFEANKNFGSSHELVLRLSEFSSDRTLGVRSSKAAAHFSSAMRKALTDPGARIHVEITPAIKAVIFDFDNTLEDLRKGIDKAHRSLARKIFETHGVFEATTVKMLDDIDHEYSLKGVGASPKNFDRHVWLKTYFRRVGISASGPDVESLVKLFWKEVFVNERLMPHAASVLKKLHSRYKIAIMTDSDGSVAIKKKRVRASGLMPHVDVFMSSDEVGRNKPNKKFYSAILEKLGVCADECVMVGDKPHVDLILAKKLGMKTVWMKYGHWSKILAGSELDYVDYPITDLKQLMGILEGS